MHGIITSITGSNKIPYPHYNRSILQTAGQYSSLIQQIGPSQYKHGTMGISWHCMEIPASTNMEQWVQYFLALHGDKYGSSNPLPLMLADGGAVLSVTFVDQGIMELQSILLQQTVCINYD